MFIIVLRLGNQDCYRTSWGDWVSDRNEAHKFDSWDVAQMISDQRNEREIEGNVWVCPV